MRRSTHLLLSFLFIIAIAVVKAHPAVSDPVQILPHDAPYIDVQKINRAAGAQVPIHTTALMASATAGAAR